MLRHERQPIHADTVFYTDSNAAVLKLDLKSGESTVVASGPPLDRPYSIAWGANGKLVIGDTGVNAVFELDCQTGEVSPAIEGPVLPFGLSVSRAGEIYVANSCSVVAFNPTTGEAWTPCDGGLVSAPLAIAFDHDKSLLVADARGGIVRVDPADGSQRMVAKGGHLSNPTALAITPRAVCVGEYETGKLISIDHKGRQTAWQLPLEVGGPVGLAFDRHGGLILSCPDAYGLAGAVVHFDPETTALTVLKVGSDNYVNARCLVLAAGGDGNTKRDPGRRN
jgi:streptogramin lyase